MSTVSSDLSSWADTKLLYWEQAALDGVMSGKQFTQDDYENLVSLKGKSKHTHNVLDDEIDRRTGYPRYSDRQCAAGYFKEIVAKGRDHRLFDLPGGGTSHFIANSKGFIVMDMLSRFVGRKQFSHSLKNLTSRYPFEQITWEQFLRTVKEGTSQDLSWFNEQWFERTSAPDYQLDWKQEDKIIIGKITQPAPFYHAVLEVEIKGVNQSLVKTVEITRDKVRFKWRVPFQVKEINLDPHYKGLRWTPEFRKQIEAK